MAWKRYWDVDTRKLWREIDVHLDVVSACRKARISDENYCYWRKKINVMGQPQSFEVWAVKKK